MSVFKKIKLLAAVEIEITRKGMFEDS